MKRERENFAMKQRMIFFSKEQDKMKSLLINFQVPRNSTEENVFCS